MRRAAFLVLGIPLVFLLGAASDDAAPVNTIRAIRAVPLGVEIEVHSTRVFPVRALPAVLRVGKAEFHRSRTPRGGGLETLVFLLTREEFDALVAGEAVSVQYGRGDAPAKSGGSTWSFGKLDKTLRGEP